MRLCKLPSSLPCLHTLWHAIPTSFYFFKSIAGIHCVSAPSLHRESTDSLICKVCSTCMAYCCTCRSKPCRCSTPFDVNIYVCCLHQSPMPHPSSLPYQLSASATGTCVRIKHLRVSAVLVQGLCFQFSYSQSWIQEKTFGLAIVFRYYNFFCWLQFHLPNLKTPY